MKYINTIITKAEKCFYNLFLGGGKEINNRIEDKKHLKR